MNEDAAWPQIKVTSRLAPHGPEPMSVASAEAVGLAWLVRLRWWAIAGQLVMWGLSLEWLGLPVQTAPTFGVVAFTAASNVLLALRRTRVNERVWVALVLCLDLLLLTSFLLFTGGAESPFSVLYVVNVAIAARVASPGVAAIAWLLSTLSFASLFVARSGHHAAHDVHYRGMWVAYALAAALTAYFVSRVTTALLERDERLARFERSAQAAQRLAATSSLAAGAAHELGTPLGTIAMLAESINEAKAVPERYRQDAKTILTELERCRDIVADLSGQSSANSADAMVTVDIELLLSRVVKDLHASEHVAANVEKGMTALLPERAFSRAVSSLVKNALDASTGRIDVKARSVANGFELCVTDLGSGISPAALERLGEPYFTTKPIGEGSGLGLYLCSVFAESLGGELLVRSQEGRGTSVTLVVPEARHG